MKAYVAGSYQFREKIREVIHELEDSIPGFECTSTWVEQGEEATELNEKGFQHFIDLDFNDVNDADILILINVGKMSKNSTGKWVELGYAMGEEKLIVVWGTAQDSLFLNDKFTIWEKSDELDDLVRTLRIVDAVHKRFPVSRK